MHSAQRNELRKACGLPVLPPTVAAGIPAAILVLASSRRAEPDNRQALQSNTYIVLPPYNPQERDERMRLTDGQRGMPALPGSRQDVAVGERDEWVDDEKQTYWAPLKYHHAANLPPAERGAYLATLDYHVVGMEEWEANS